MGKALLVSACVVATGCVTSHMQRLDSDVRQARAPDSVVVFQQVPERPHTVIAQIESKTGTVFQGFDDLRAKIIDQAAQLGGDGVIVGPESKETNFLILPTGLIPMETKKLAASVIVFR